MSNEKVFKVGKNVLIKNRDVVESVSIEKVSVCSQNKCVKTSNKYSVIHCVVIGSVL